MWRWTGLTVTALAAAAGLLLAINVHGADWPRLQGDATRNAVSLEPVPPLAWEVEEGENGKLLRTVRNLRWVAQLSSSAGAEGNREGKASARAPGHWAQWRGPDRSNVSAETGLLKEWPKAGPPLAWKAEGLGQGVASITVTGGRVFTLGYLDNKERVAALEEVSGKKLWSVDIGPAVAENALMRWLSQRTPTVDEDRLYTFTTRGELACLQTADGKELWRKDYVKEFKGSKPVFGYCDRPLVDGDRLICVPGGADNTVVALDKKSGKVIWACSVPGNPKPSYSATVVAQAGGVRQYVTFVHNAVIGVSTEGKFLWEYKKIANGIANNYTPLVRGDYIFLASGYGNQVALLKLTANQGALQVEEIYRQKLPLRPWHDNAILFGDHVYLGGAVNLTCLEFLTGKVAWQAPGALGGLVSPTMAAGFLYLHSTKGKVALVEATAKGYLEKGLFQVPETKSRSGATNPVIAGGRLYLRDDDRLFCYDVKAGPADKAPPPKPDKPGENKPKPTDRIGHDVFVPTPQDVVEKMLELAKVQKKDAIYDLGCGDGRIVVTAARKYGCQAFGYDIDPECVNLSKENVAKHDLGKLVAIEKKDIFTLDLKEADVVALYLLPRTLERLLPQLNKLKPGARIVSHAFAIPGVRPDRVVGQRSEEDELEHKIYLYTAPFHPCR